MLTASARLWSYPRRRLCSVCCIFKQTFPFCFFPLPAGEARWWAWSLERGAWGSLWEGVKLGWVGRRIRLCFCFRSAGGEEGCGGGGVAAALAAQSLNRPPLGSALCLLPCPRPKQSRCLFSQPRPGRERQARGLSSANQTSLPGTLRLGVNHREAGTADKSCPCPRRGCPSNRMSPWDPRLAPPAFASILWVTQHPSSTFSVSLKRHCGCLLWSSTLLTGGQAASEFSFSRTAPTRRPLPRPCAQVQGSREDSAHLLLLPPGARPPPIRHAPVLPTLHSPHRPVWRSSRLRAPRTASGAHPRSPTLHHPSACLLALTVSPVRLWLGGDRQGLCLLGRQSSGPSPPDVRSLNGLSHPFCMNERPREPRCNFNALRQGLGKREAAWEAQRPLCSRPRLPGSQLGGLGGLRLHSFRVSTS